MTQTIEIPPTSTDGLWLPVEGKELEWLLQHARIGPDEKDTLRAEARRVLSRCPDPNAEGGSTTELVVGFVQSGKTMNFTAVTALARDNRYPIVIVIAGTSVPLFRQSEERLKSDLRLDSRYDRQWRHFSNPTTQVRADIEAVLLDWDDPEVPDDERQTILITVMKHHGRLGHLTTLLGQLDLAQRPVVVIDDEADHAGLNSKVNQNDMSTTYERILTLRGLLPHHGYLMYTATPQAPLLISTIDTLSPDTATVLTPGNAYTGGQEFFEDRLDELVREIPEEDDDEEDDEEAFRPPPESFKEALAGFFVGVAVGMIKRDEVKNRSMMVHPSQYTAEHSEHYQWVEQIKHQWLSVLKQPDDEPAKAGTATEFRAAYDDLAGTVDDLPPWEDVWKTLPRAIRKTLVKEINATRGKTPEIDWNGNYAWILVGGQAMDRGFTVEGLTVTYMPRGIGVGNADAIQQRARFFGYKGSYLGYCRVWLAPQTKLAFERYVVHERDLHKRLETHMASGQSLKDWKRRFFLDKTLRATRRNVLRFNYEHVRTSNDWFWPKAPHEPADAVEENRQLVGEFSNTFKFDADTAVYPLASQQHMVAKDASLEEAHEILARYRLASPKDSMRYTGVLLQLREFLDQHEGQEVPRCTIYMMATKDRKKRTAKNGGLEWFFQGAYPPAGELKGTQYPGDEKLHDDRVTIQVHRYRVDAEGGAVSDVPFIAIWVPAGVGHDVVVQDEDE